MKLQERHAISVCDGLWTWQSVAPQTRVCAVASLFILTIALAFIALPRCLLATARRSQAPADIEENSVGYVRSAWLDNARFLLITSIVFGHVVCVPTLFVPERDYYLQPLLVFSGLYHIPMLSFISGVFSKRSLTQDRVARLITHVIVPYIFSKIAWWIFYYMRSPVVPNFNLFDSYQSGGLEWYLAALLCWRLTLALLAPLNAYAMVVVSLALGLLSGYWVGNDQLFALQRALAFFPFAAAGYLFDAGAAERLLRSSKSLQTAARCALLGMLIFCLNHRRLLSYLDLGVLGDLNFDYYHQRMETRGWVWQTRTPCGLDWHLSWTYRVVHYALHFSVGATFLAAMPIGKSFMTEAGSQTMYPYLLHTWVTMAIAPVLENHQALLHYIVSPGFFPGGWVWSVAGVCSLPLTLCLSSKPIRFIFGPLIEPKWIGRLIFEQEALVRSPTSDDSLEDGQEKKFYRRMPHAKQ